MKVKFLHVESDNIDLEITPGEKRQWIGISGRNIPSFEIFVSPDWRGTRGKYYADQPSYRSGNRVEGVRLEFNRGKVIKMTAESGRKFVKNQGQIKAIKRPAQNRYLETKNPYSCFERKVWID